MKRREYSFRQAGRSSSPGRPVNVVGSVWYDVLHGATQGDGIRRVRPRRVGVSPVAIGELGERLWRFSLRYGGCFRTVTRDASAYAGPHVSALLRMNSKRTFAGIGCDRPTRQP